MSYLANHGLLRTLLPVLAASGALACGASEDTDGLFEQPLGASATQTSDAATLPSGVALVDAIAGANQVACMGTLISPHVVLTTAMCLHRFGSWRVTLPGVSGNVMNASRAATLDWSATNPTRHNVGVIFLNEAVPLSQFPKLAARPVADGTQAFTFARVKDGTLSNNSAFTGPKLTLRSGAPEGAAYDYLAAGELSQPNQGAPVELEDRTLVAMFIGAADGTLNLTRIDLIRDWLNEQMRLAGDVVDSAKWIDMTQDPRACTNQPGVACGWAPNNNGQGYTCGFRHPEWLDGWTCER